MLTRTLLLLFLIITTYSFNVNTVYSQNTGTLKDRNGEIMRGYPMVIGKQYENTSTAFALNPKNWQTLKDSARNTVRLCWIGPWMEDRYGKEGFDWVKPIWDMNKIAEVMDSCIAIATAKQMNVIINYHNVSEQQNPKDFVSQENINMKRLTKFWVTLAPRYKDNDLVYYEIANEPIWKGDTNSGYRDPEFMANLIGVYDTIRALAPERHILIFSTNSMKYDFQGITKAYDPYLDWDYTSVAYHMYSTPTSSSVVELAKTHHVICTEWGYPSFNQPYVVKVDGNDICAQTLEAIGHSWIDWHNWNDATFNVTFFELNPDARKKGYAWWVDEINIKPPGENFDLSAWKLQTLNETDSSYLQIDDTDELNVHSSKFFYTDSTDGSMVFRCTSNGGTTSSGTKYPRVELRQMRDGANWSLSNKDEHYLNAECKVMKVAEIKPKTIIGQIHGSESNSEMLKIRWTGYEVGKCYVEARFQKNDNEGSEYGVKLAEGLSLGDLIEYSVTMKEGTVSVTVNGKTASQTYTSEYYGTTDKYYFKAGNYIQWNDDIVNAPPSVSGVNKFYQLSVGVEINSDTNDYEILTRNRFKLYPNPTKGLVNLSQVSNFKVYNITGKLIMTGKAKSIDLTHVESGLYLVETDDFHVEKIVKH